MPKKENAQIRTKKAHNTTLEKLCEEKKEMHKSESNKHLTLPYKYYAKKKKSYKFEPKKAPCTNLQKTTLGKINCTNSSQKGT